MYSFGLEAASILKHLSISDAERKDVIEAMDACEAYFKPKKNIVNETFLINSSNQQSGESINSFHTRLHQNPAPSALLAAAIALSYQNRLNVKDRLIMDNNDTRTRTQILRDTDITL